MNIYHVKHEDKALFDCNLIKLLDLYLLFVTMNFTDLLEGKNSLKSISHELPSQRTFNLLNLFLIKQSNRYIIVFNDAFFLDVLRVVDIDESKIAALIGKMAKPLFIDISEYVGQNSSNIIFVLGMVVDDVIGLLENLQEFCYF